MSDSQLRQVRPKHPPPRPRLPLESPVFPTPRPSGEYHLLRAMRPTALSSAAARASQGGAAASSEAEEKEPRAMPRSLRFVGHHQRGDVMTRSGNQRSTSGDSSAAAPGVWRAPDMSRPTSHGRPSRTQSTGPSMPHNRELRVVDSLLHAADSSAFASTSLSSASPSFAEVPRRRSSRSVVVARLSGEPIPSRAVDSLSHNAGISTGGRSRPRPSPSSIATAAASTVMAAKKPPPSSSQRKPPPASATSSSSRKRSAAPSLRTPAASKRSRSSPKPKPPPNAKNDADYDDQPSSGAKGSPETAVAEVNCCICMSEPELSELAKISGCEHQFCFGCIAKWSERENKCPLCKERFTKICRVHPQRTSRGNAGSGSSSRRSVNTKTVKQRDQRSDYLPASALEGILQSLYAASSGSGPLNPLMRQLLSSGFAASRSDAETGVTFGDGFDSDDDDDGDDEMFQPFSLFVGAQAAQFRMARISASFPAMAVLSMPSSMTGGTAETGSSTSSTRLRFMSNPHAPRYLPRVASSAEILAPPSLAGYASQSNGGLSISFGLAAAAAATQPSRSYATNFGDATAGSDAANPLEIDDSSDDEVQVVSVNYPAASAS